MSSPTKKYYYKCLCLHVQSLDISIVPIHDLKSLYQV